MPAEPSAASTTAPDSTSTRTSTLNRLSVDVRQVPWVRALSGDYAFNFSKLAGLYAGDPTSLDAWRTAIGRAQQHSRQRTEIGRIIAAQQMSRSAPSAALAAGQTLLDPRAVTVVTGQQAGAFGGPLFTLLKAITAIQLARRTAAEHKTPAVAVFWVDAEDHDWEEVARCTVLDATFHPRTIELAPPEGAGELPVAALKLDERVEESLEELAQVLAPTDFTSWVVGGLRDTYRSGTRVSDAFARWLEALLGPYGLIVFESSDPAAKPLAARVFSQELATPGRTAGLAAAAGDAMAARGHAPQVVPQQDSPALFHLGEARRPIRRHPDGFLIGENIYSGDALATEVASSPQQFSPNVLLRPIVQDTLFPTICYVAGPNELAYLGQLGGIYEQFDVPMPLMYPRATATIVDSATARFLTRYDLPLQELQPQDESALNRLLQSQLPPSVEHALKEADDAIRRSMQRLIDALPALDPTLAGAARTTLGKMEHELRALQSKMIHTAKRRDETLRRQYTRAQAQTFPHGQPQERALAVVFFLNRYGPAFVDRLLAELPLDPGKHWVMTI